MKMLFSGLCLSLQCSWGCSSASSLRLLVESGSAKHHPPKKTNKFTALSGAEQALCLVSKVDIGGIDI